MKMRIPLILAAIFALCGCRKNESYFVLIGDRSVPSYEKIEVGATVSPQSPLMVFSNHEGSSFAVLWDGKKEADFSGMGGVTLSRKSGSLEVNGRLTREMYLFIVKGKSDGSNGILTWKSVIPPNQEFKFQKDLK